MQTPPALNLNTLRRIQRKIKKEAKELCVDAFLDSQDLFDDATRLMKLSVPGDGAPQVNVMYYVHLADKFGGGRDKTVLMV